MFFFSPILFASTLQEVIYFQSKTKRNYLFEYRSSPNQPYFTLQHYIRENLSEPRSRRQKNKRISTPTNAQVDKPLAKYINIPTCTYVNKPARENTIGVCACDDTF